MIPARDRPEALAVCLRAVGPAAEVVVVDDGSTDQREIERVTRAENARVVRLDRRAGPAAARNAGVAATDAPLVAFVDSDARPQNGWLEPLLAHFADPEVGAVAPRIRVPPGRASLDAYERARSPLDLGDRPAIVGLGRRVRFVPATALVVRRDAAQHGFDPALRFGEDVDFVWRLGDAGWTVRYEPAATIEHPRRADPRAWLCQRVEYGSSAAPLATRHPGELSHLVVAVPRAATLAPGLRRELAPLVARARLRAARRMLDAAWRAYSPLLLAAIVSSRRARRPAAAALAISVAADYLERRPRLDPLRYGALKAADDLAYATGVWLGCIKARNAGPLLPRLVASPRRDNPAARARTVPPP